LFGLAYFPKFSAQLHRFYAKKASKAAFPLKLAPRLIIDKIPSIR